MMRHCALLMLVAALLGFGPIGIVASSPAEARSCKHEYIRSWGRPSRTMYGARISARLAWKRASRAIFGTKYDTWWPSRRKSMRCHTNRRNLKRCRAGAFPCTIL